MLDGPPLRLPDPCLVVLVGATAAGKSDWAARWFHPDQVVSSDRLRAVVGTGERDVRASRDAFDVLDLIVAKRMARRLLTVVDTPGLEPARRAAWRALAERHGVPAHAVVLDPPRAEVRRRNRERASPVPAKVVAGQLREVDGVLDRLAGEGFAGVHRAGPVELVPPAFLTAPLSARRQQEDPMPLRFGLQVSRFDFDGHPATTAAALGAVARAAEDAGFESLWLMDHMVQIPQIGREWEDMLESWTTLGFIAGVTERIRLGTLVTGITYRNVAHLAKVVATLDVLSGGRAQCGIGAAWFEREHRLYGWEFPPLRGGSPAASRARARARRAWRSTSAATASSPRRACRPRSSDCRTRAAPSRWRASPRSSRRSATMGPARTKRPPGGDGRLGSCCPWRPRRRPHSRRRGAGG